MAEMLTSLRLRYSICLWVLSDLMINCKRIGQSFLCRQTAMVLIKRSQNLPGRNKFRILEKVWHRQSILALHANLTAKKIFLSVKIPWSAVCLYSYTAKPNASDETVTAFETPGSRLSQRTAVGGFCSCLQRKAR